MYILYVGNNTYSQPHVIIIQMGAFIYKGPLSANIEDTCISNTSWSTSNCYKLTTNKTGCHKCSSTIYGMTVEVIMFRTYQEQCYTRGWPALHCEQYAVTVTYNAAGEEDYFLDLNKRLVKYAPDGWLEKVIMLCCINN